MPPARRSAATSSSCASVGAPPIAQRFTFCTIEQLARVHDCGRRNFLAAEHSRNFRHTLFSIIETADARARMPAGIFFPNEEVRRREAGDLRQMRDADDLIARGELLKLSPDDFRHPPANPGIDLVK